MPNRNEPKASVIIPVYNGAKYLEQALLSITKQSLEDIEILVMDDGSTDSSLEIIQKIASGDDRLTIFQREQRGLITTLNELVSLSKTNIIARMDADDICLPTRLQKQIQYLHDNPDCAVIGTETELINEKGMKICEIKPPLNHDDIEKTLLAGHAAISHPSACFRKDLFLEVGGYSLDYPSAEDLDLWLRMSEVGKLSNFGEVLLLYRIHDNSISGKKYIEQLNSARKATTDAWQRRGISGVFEAEGGWRANNSVDSQYDYALQYGWRSWKSKNYRTSFHYFKKAISNKFYDYKAWILLYAIVFKRP